MSGSSQPEHGRAGEWILGQMRSLYKMRTCSIITGEPNELVRKIHTRMPVILPEDKLDVWLSGEAGKEILVPYPADQMTVWPISPRVNSPKNDDPGILEPVAVDALARRPG